MENTEQTLQILSNATGTNTELLNIKVSPETGDIVVQLDVFDKSSRTSSTSSIDLNSHQDVFQSILQQIYNTPCELAFLNVLHNLLRIDSNEAISHMVWNVIQKLVHCAIQLETKEDAERLLNSTLPQTNSCRKFNTSLIPSTTQPIPPPPPPIRSTAPPPPPLPLNVISNSPPPPPQPLQRGCAASLLPQQNTPKSSKKLKTLNWAKIPNHKIMHKTNIWTIMANDRQYKCVEAIDFKGIERLFCLQTTNKKKTVDEVDNSGRVGKEKIHLLDSKFSLKINIFLTQFKSFKAHDDIVQLIRNGNHKVMGLEKLKDLIKFFENEEGIALLTNFNGDRQQLGSAEKFILLVMDMPNYKLRIKSMKLKEEFNLNFAYLKPCIQEILKAGNELMKSQALQDILAIIILIGNFLNSDGYAGNAAGIKLSSLNSLSEIKANKNGMNLLHLIAIEVERYNPKLLNLSKELAFLENVNRVNIEQIAKDIKDLESGVSSIKKQIISPTTAEDLKQQMLQFLQDTESHIKKLIKSMEDLRTLRITMAEFFCEDLKHFKVDECFSIFHKFCEQFKQAVKENEKRLFLEQQASKKQSEQKTYGGEHKSNLKPNRLKSFKTDSNENFKISNSKKNEDELMEFLQTQQYETCLKKGKLRDDKRPNSLKLNYKDERERYSVHSFQSEYFKNHSLAVNERKTNIIQKPLKHLIINSTANRRLKDKCLTPDLRPKRESLKIFIRSNSTVDSKPGLLLKQPSMVRVIKTPLIKNKTEFNFSTNDIRADKSTGIETVEIKQPKISVKTMAHIAQLGHRYSSINEEDLKRTIKNLRTPTLENNEFCWSSTLENQPRNFPVSPLAVENGFDLNYKPVTESRID